MDERMKIIDRMQEDDDWDVLPYTWQEMGIIVLGISTIFTVIVGIVVCFLWK
jgi:hypothetical protein